MKKQKKTSKGYRLKPETHKMIIEIQKYLRGSKDDSINLACRQLLGEIRKGKSEINLIKKKNSNLTFVN